MSNRKKPDARSLFKQAKGRQNGGGGNSVPGLGRASGGTRGAAEAGSAARGEVSKYKGKSKEELLALLKLKQAQAKTQKAAPTQPRVVPRPATQAIQSPPPAKPVVVLAAKRPAAPTSAKVPSAVTGALTGLLGIGDDDSSSSDEEAEAENIAVPNINTEAGRTKADNRASASTETPTAKTDIPEGLPAGFFDEEPAELEESAPQLAQKQNGIRHDASSLHPSHSEEIDGSVDASGALPAAPSGRIDPALAAQLEAEAVAQAEADDIRIREATARALAEARAAGVASTDGTMAGKVAVEDVEEDADGAGEAPNGSALPEGFFDDPEVDAKSRGVDLMAKKKEEEQNEWKEFMMFAEEVKKTEKEEEQQEEEQEEDKGLYEELEQATMMGRLAMLMNKSESIGRKRKRPEGSFAEAEHGDEEGVADEKAERDEKSAGGMAGSGESKRDGEEVELSVAKAGSAMREVAVASAPADAAAAEISAMLKSKKRRKKEEVEDAFAGEYVPMNPLDWRAKGR